MTDSTLIGLATICRRRIVRALLAFESQVFLTSEKLDKDPFVVVLGTHTKIGSPTGDQ